MTETTTPRRRIAVIGTGISGLSAAWLLSKRHDVDVFEADDRIGGHSNTVDIEIDGRTVAVDTGFIVYNEPCYPNLTALFDHLGVETAATDMSFAVSLDRGRVEYAGTDLLGLFAQPANLLRPRFWSMLADLLRFYREAPAALVDMGEESLDDWLDARGYGAAFREDHLHPMAAAIWSTPAMEVGRYPVAAFVRFCQNHGLLRLTDRPVWRTVVGGSRNYVARLSAPFADRIRLSTPVAAIRRLGVGVEVIDGAGVARRYDRVVIATHADRALAMLADPDADERRLLSAFRYSQNEAVLHGDPDLMPERRRAWASWNYLSDGRGHDRRLSVSYWMNRLQPLGAGVPDLFVTLNPLREPRSDRVHARIAYDHPVFDVATFRAQKEIWSLQGRRDTWFCGAHFGAGFHEDGLQAGLAAAEDVGGTPRPWTVADPDGRIHRTAPRATPAMGEAAE
jgi:uncharacterized protein